MRAFSLLLLAAGFAAAQPFSAGIKGGVPLTDFLNTAENGHVFYSTVPNRYIIGAMAELRLPFGLGVEFDALYRHLNYAASGGLTGVTPITTSTTTANAWEFPLVAKYRFHAPLVRPYIEGGIAWDTLQGVKQSILSGTSLGSTSSPADLNKTTTTGFVLGAGVDIHALVIHIAPEIRYTRWGAQHFLDPNGLLSSNQNQAEFLVGITF